MFVRNSWYVAAQASEVTRFRPLSRVILGTRVVLFRGEDGAVIALEDRCPHRFAQLSAGSVVGNAIRCGYHGMTFNSQGKCILNPTQKSEAIPPNAVVRPFTVAEKHSLIWIWAGDPKHADTTSIPNFSCYGDAGWNWQIGRIHIKANYLVIMDNLLDLSHVNFVHGDVLGDASASELSSLGTEIGERTIVEKRLHPNAPAVPAWRAMVDAPWITSPVDYWMDMYWNACSNMILDVGVTPAGTSRLSGRSVMAIHCLLPETATSTHYFYGIAQRNESGNEASTSGFMQASAYAFEQDRRVCELVQENMGADWDILKLAPVINKADKAALLARRKILAMMDAEAKAA
jgi:phenylpropionate dioxygenase-like ring-hydroxylating dioxygenase large terminal subunit